ncbi:hypothetical protein CRE_07483 [Caenorhabditis remanei]|uniref:Uncharacterized protein n=1 Tax=Caenorhabditis remanei TaxID=31234 RepID=E3M2T0_CAERE|nr:hypothetical protein CRE_07483 [Caenorhabditis remanei]
MATLYPVSVSAQFITPPPSTSNDLHNHNDSDSGSSSGVSAADEMKSSEDDAVSTSSQQSPPEHPSPPPPSNSPPESMASLQAESPIGDEDTEHDVGEFSPPLSNEGTSSAASMTEEPKEWNVGNGFHTLPTASSIPPNSETVFLHLMDGRLDLSDPNGEVVGSIDGPATLVYAAEATKLSGPLPIALGPNQKVHQYLDEEVPNSGEENQSENSMNESQPSPPGPSRGGHHSNGPRNGNIRNYNGNQQNWNQRNGNHRNGNQRNGNGHGQNGYRQNSHGQNGDEQNGHGQNGYRQNGHGQNGYRQNGHAQNGHAQNGHAPNGRVQNGDGQNGDGQNVHVQNGDGQNGHGQSGHGQNGYRQNGRGENVNVQNEHVNNENGYRNNNHNAGGNRFNGNRYSKRHRGDFQGRVRVEHQGRGQGEYQERAHRDQAYSNVNSLQEFPELSANNSQPMPAMAHQNAALMMNPQNDVNANQMFYGPPIPVPQQHASLLGAPNGPSVSDLTQGGLGTGTYMPGPPLFDVAQQSMLMNMPLQEMSVPPPMNGQMMMMTAPVSQDPSALHMALPSHLYGVPPPALPGMMTVPEESLINNNNLWNEELEKENEALDSELLQLLAPQQANALATELEFTFHPLMLTPKVKQTFNLSTFDIQYKATVMVNNGQFDRSFIVEEPTVLTDGRFLHREKNFAPNTSYQIYMEVYIPTRSYVGKRSEYGFFRTAPGRPDPPTRVHVFSRGLHFVTLRWDLINNNGANVYQYQVSIDEDKPEGRMMQATGPEVTITTLEPQTCYKIKIYSISAIGQSLSPALFDAWTKPDQKPFMPQNITVTALSPHSILVTWDSNPNDTFTLELFSVLGGKTNMFRIDPPGGNTIIGQLMADSEYQLCIHAMNKYGQIQTEFFNVRTQRKPNANRLTQNGNIDERNKSAYVDEAPSKPYFLQYVNDCPEMAWNEILSPTQEYSFIVEGSISDETDSFVQLHRGNVLSYIVLDNTINYLRVIKVNKREMRSLPSPIAPIPRDITIHRPERVSNVTVSAGPNGNVLVCWTKLDREIMNIPTSAKIVYHVQRCDLTENPVVNVGDAERYTFEKIPGNTKLAVQVRASVTFRNEMTSGDWCTPVPFTTPRGLPPPVGNIKFDSRSSTLSWSCADQSQDLQFTATVVHLSTKRNVLKVTTKSRNVVLDSVQPGEKYAVDIYSSTAVGCNPQNTSLEFVVPALKPSTPIDTFVSQIHTQGFKITWKAADSNGAPITSYTVRVLLNSEFVVEDLITKSQADGTYKAEFKNLSANTEYLVTVSAKNNVGIGQKAEIVARTHANPPTVPEIFCEPEPFSLRFQWEKDESNPNIQYLLVRQNLRGPHVTVYRGDKALVRVKSLQESTKYYFRLQISDTATGASTWSDTFSFSTSTAPPPPIKQVPTTTPVPGKTYLYKIEWLDCLIEQKRQNQFYRLQTADATVKKAKWETVYEGKTPSYELKTDQFPGAIHVRVLVARQESEDNELRGSPSPVGYIANLPPDVDDDDEEEESVVPFYRNFSPTSVMSFIMYILIFCIVMCISCTNNVLTRIASSICFDTSVSHLFSPEGPASQPPPSN